MLSLWTMEMTQGLSYFDLSADSRELNLPTVRQVLGHDVDDTGRLATHNS